MNIITNLLILTKFNISCIKNNKRVEINRKEYFKQIIELNHVIHILIILFNKKQNVDANLQTYT